jgi:hypothetical protein
METKIVSFALAIAFALSALLVGRDIYVALARRIAALLAGA